MTQQTAHDTVFTSPRVRRVDTTLEQLRHVGRFSEGIEQFESPRETRTLRASPKEWNSCLRRRANGTWGASARVSRGCPTR